jgi:plastocyanin
MSLHSPLRAQPIDMIMHSSNVVNLRIEGLTNTIYEGPIFSGPRNITTASGGTHPCDGTNNGANPTPGNTPTGALDAASKFAKFPFDGTYSAAFNDFFITSIGTSTQTATQFWGLLVNFQFTPVGGCQAKVNPGDSVLWAFDAFNQNAFLKVEPKQITAKKGQTKTVTVTDGSTGAPASGAVIDGVTTDAGGKATLTFPKRGIFTYKATRSDALRSNALVVVVL